MLVSARIKQTLGDACLWHVLFAEGDDWFHPEKLTSVKSRLNMPMSCVKSRDLARRTPLKRSGASTNLQDTIGVNKTVYPQGHAKFNVFTSENRPLKCWVCHRLGHRLIDCKSRKSEQSRTVPRALFNKS